MSLLLSVSWRLANASTRRVSSIAILNFRTPKKQKQATNEVKKRPWERTSRCLLSELLCFRISEFCIIRSHQSCNLRWGKNSHHWPERTSIWAFIITQAGDHVWESPIHCSMGATSVSSSSYILLILIKISILLYILCTRGFGVLGFWGFGFRV